MAIPLGRPLPDASRDLPGRQRGNALLRHPYLVLLPVGLAVPSPLPETRCALTAPFHPCLGNTLRAAAVCFLWHFPWGGLALAGVGLWPQTRKHRLKVSFEDGLRAFGYGLRPEMDVATETVIEAFQRHFRPSKIDGVADEECKRILAALLAEIDLGP